CVLFPFLSNQRSYNSLKALAALDPALLKIFDILARFIPSFSRFLNIVFYFLFHQTTNHVYNSLNVLGALRPLPFKILDIRARATPLSFRVFKYCVLFLCLSNQRSYNSLKALGALDPALPRILNILDRDIPSFS
ncbi:hypothetical protein Avbf_11094, partial [Armadillidium vulgare]